MPILKKLIDVDYGQDKFTLEQLIVENQKERDDMKVEFGEI